MPRLSNEKNPSTVLLWMFLSSLLKRGDKEDRALYVAFQRVITRGTEYYDGDRFRAIQWNLRFLPKSMNIIGTQIADLAAYPVARFALDQKKKNPAYEVIRPKFLRDFIKIFP